LAPELLHGVPRSFTGRYHPTYRGRRRFVENEVGIVVGIGAYPTRLVEDAASSKASRDALNDRFQQLRHFVVGRGWEVDAVNLAVVVHPPGGVRGKGVKVNV